MAIVLPPMLGLPLGSLWFLYAASLGVAPGDILVQRPLELQPGDLGAPRAVLLDDARVRGWGQIEALQGLAIDNAGRCLLLAEFGGDTSRNECVLLDGTPVLLEGEGVRGEVGLSISGVVTPFPAQASDLRGFPAACEVAWIAELGGTESDLGATALFLGAEPVALSGQGYDGQGLGSRATWRGFRGLSSQGSNNVFVARMDAGSARPTTALLQLALDANGSATFTTRITAGELVRGAGSASLQQLSERPRGLASSANGDWVVAATLLDDEQTLGALLRNGRLELADGDLCSDTGEQAASLANAVVALDDLEGLAWIAKLSTGDSLAQSALVVDGRVMARVAHALPGTASQLGPLQSFGIGSPLLRGPGGRVIWFGRFDTEMKDTDTALFLGDRVLVREGDQTHDGRTLDLLSEGAGAIALSPNGRWLLFSARLDDGTGGVFRIALGTISTDSGCGLETSSLRVRSGRIAPGSKVVLEFARAQGSEAPLDGGWLLLSDPLQQREGSCGRPTPFGHLLLESAGVRSVQGTLKDGGQRVEFELVLPTSGHLPGRGLALQAVGLNADASLSLSQGLIFQL